MRYPRYEPTDPLGGGLRALEASAGTGKTYAITSTLLRLVVEHALQMDEALLVTFTRAATAELQQRVRDRLVDGARALARAVADADWEPDDAVLAHVVELARGHVGIPAALARVEEALRTVDEATITTIHGFCHQVLQQAAVAADSDPDVAIDTDDERLVTAVTDDWMIRFVHTHADDEHDEEALADLLGSMSLDREGLLEVAHTVAAEPDPVLLPELPDTPPDLSAVLGAQRAVGEALDTAQQTVDAAQACKDDGEINGNDRYAPQRANRLPGRLAKLRAAHRDGKLDDDALGRLDPAGDDGQGTRPMPARIAATPLPQAVRRCRALRTEVEAWIRRRLAEDVRVELEQRRQQAGTASFADLLRRLDAALAGDTGAAIVAEIGVRFRAVLIDEFQDTDPVQWSILHGLFGDVELLAAGDGAEEVRLFDVVGDPKQAIYGWRGADLETYKRALREAGEIRTMERNHRSDAGFVAACNRLLDEPGSLGGRGVEYVAVDTPDRDDPRLVDEHGTDRAGLQLVHLQGIGGRRSNDLREAVAAAVAEDVVRTLRADLELPDEDHEDDDGPLVRRPLEARDCAVLVRRHAEAAAVADQLRLRGVAVVVGGGSDVLQSDEAAAVADLLRVLTSPGDDRALRRLLVGPFVGLTAEQVSGLSDDKWQQHYVNARTWATTWAEDGIAAAVQRALREGRAERHHARLRTGERTMTNIRHVTELLHLVEQEEALGTHALAAWFDARRAEAEEERTPPERELRLERDDAAVKVMTVHAAKGLEFPLVWVPFLWSKEGRNDGSAPFVVNDPDNDHTRTVALHAASSGALRADPERTRLRTAYDREQWESGLRLAYVALTRAVHRCTVHTVAQSRGRAVVKSSAWQLLWRELGSGAPDADHPKVDEDQMLDQLRRLAEHDHIELDVLPPQQQGAHTDIDAGRDQDRPPLAARSYDRADPLDVGWGRASFTGLLRGRVAPEKEDADDADEADRDETADRQAHRLTELPPQVWQDAAPVPLADLPRGAAWGTFLHDVLEHADFATSVDDLAALVADRARRSAVHLDDAELEVATTGLHAALATPLGPALGELRLRDLGRGDRLDELDFTLTLADRAGAAFDVRAVAEAFARHDADVDAPLAAAAEHLQAGGRGRPVHGLLIGSIDLVLRHDGRFWIADYKSNGLGQWVEDDDGERTWVETPAHTGPDRVMAAMLHGDYLLQAHLYLVALHRYLRARLGPDYDYDRHVGGWAYLFLRGMTGPDVRRDADGHPHGIATGRPTRALVEELDALLRGGAPDG